MKKKAHELEFISQINRDGSGTTSVKESYLKAMNESSIMRDEYFKLKRLSITEDTYIAFNFNAFVVRIKKPIGSQVPLHTENGIVIINDDGLIIQERFYPKKPSTDLGKIKKQFPKMAHIKPPTELNIESEIIKHWREDKSISEIVNLTKRTREEVIDIISEYIKREMDYELY